MWPAHCFTRRGTSPTHNIECERDPCLILYTVYYFTHSVSFYTQCVILHTVCNFTQSVRCASVNVLQSLVTRWCISYNQERTNLYFVRIWPPDGVLSMKCKFGHQAAPLGLVQMLVIRWRRLHKLQILSQGWVTCITKLALSVWFELTSLDSHQFSLHKMLYRNPDSKIGPQIFWS